MPRYHLDTDFLVFATSETGLERERLLQIAASDATIEMSAIAWYEYARGPRLPEQLALARFVLEDDGVIPLTDELASRAADTFRLLGSPRRRANDVAIGVTAVVHSAVLLTRNAHDFAGIDGLHIETSQP